MTRFPRAAAAIGLLAVASFSFAQSKAATVTVSDAVSLVRALAPGKTVVLEKGDYLLSSAFGVEGEYAKWEEVGGSKELCLTGVDGLKIRGPKGTRIVSDSASAVMLAVYDSRNVAFEGITFARPAAEDAEYDVDSGDGEAGACSLYAEGVAGLALRGCSFEGGAATAIELWGCEGVSVERCDISGATSGALSASLTKGLAISGSRVAACSGYPLLYFVDSGDVLVKDTRFEGNEGNLLVEILADEGEAGAVRFDGCAFEDNDLDYFSGPEHLPVTDSCRFGEGNSFGEDWKTDAVAPQNDDEETPSSEEAPRQYVHSSGLAFDYPAGWEIVEYGRESRVGVFAPDGGSLALFLVAGHVPANVLPSASAKRLFADSAVALAGRLKAAAGIALSIEADGEPYTDNGLLSADYKGRAAKGEGARASARARFVASGDLVCAMLGLAEDPSSLGTESEIDGIFASIVRVDSSRRGE
jgi:hypothetical protein